MTSYSVYFRQLNRADSFLRRAEEDANDVQVSYRNLIECRRALFELRRSFLFTDNGHKDVTELSSVVEKLHMAENDFIKSKIKYQTSISIAASLLAEIIKDAVVNAEKFPYPKYRNGVRAILQLVNKTEAKGIDYSALASTVASISSFLAFCEQKTDIIITARLYKSILDSL